MSAASLVIGLPGVTVRIRSTVPAVTEALGAIYRS